MPGTSRPLRGAPGYHAMRLAVSPLGQRRGRHLVLVPPRAAQPAAAVRWRLEPLLREAARVESARRVLSTLTRQEEQVLRLRFGINAPRDLTWEEIAHRFLLSRARIRQIEANALRKLRQPRRSRWLHPWIDG